MSSEVFELSTPSLLLLANAGEPTGGVVPAHGYALAALLALVPVVSAPSALSPRVLAPGDRTPAPPLATAIESFDHHPIAAAPSLLGTTELAACESFDPLATVPCFFLNCSNHQPVYHSTQVRFRSIQGPAYQSRHSGFCKSCHCRIPSFLFFARSYSLRLFLSFSQFSL